MNFNFDFEIQNYFRTIEFEIININDDNNDDNDNNDDEEDEIVALIDTIAISFSKFTRNRYVAKDQILLENIDVNFLEMHEFIESSHEKEKYVKKIVEMMNILNQRERKKINNKFFFKFSFFAKLKKSLKFKKKSKTCVV